MSSSCCSDKGDDGNPSFPRKRQRLDEEGENSSSAKNDHEKNDAVPVRVVSPSLPDVQKMVEQSLGKLQQPLNDDNDHGSGARLKTENDDDNNAILQHAPPGLEEPFQLLHRTLSPCLLRKTDASATTTTTTTTTNTRTSTNASVLIQGPRGSGKSWLVAQVLHAFRQQHQAKNQNNNKIKKPPFRVVTLHGGALNAGANDVSVVVGEILRQLATQARAETQIATDHHERETKTTTADKTTATATNDGSSSNNNNNYALPAKQNKQTPKTTNNATDQWLGQQNEQQTNHTNTHAFVNHLQLLNEILALAQVDQIPIVLILDDLEAFWGNTSTNSTNANNNNSSTTSPSHRQVLLYHLLDRVATDGSFLCFVGLTSHTAVVRSWEKRIQSRAQGTTPLVPLGSNAQQWSRLLTVRLDGNIPGLRRTLERVAQPLPSSSTMMSLPPTTATRLSRALARDQALGKPLAWFLRVWTYALSLYRYDLQRQRLEKKNGPTPEFSEDYLLTACADMGGSLDGDTLQPKQQHQRQEQQKQQQKAKYSANHHSVIRLVQGQATESRLRAVCDVTAHQAVVLVATRRLLARDNRRGETDRGNNNSNTTTTTTNNNNSSNSQYQQPLTAQRLIAECKGFYKSSRTETAQSRRRTNQIRAAIQGLLDMGLLQLASAKVGMGGAAFQYQPQSSSLRNSNSSSNATRWMEQPLQCTLDVFREFPSLLEPQHQSLWGCSTALREWGKRVV